MADIKSILEDLAVLSPEEVQEIAMIMQNADRNEAIENPYHYQEGAVTVKLKDPCPTSPKQYGISLLNRKRKKK